MDDPNNQQQFAVSLKTDRDGFLRRCCPKCGRDFKTEINAADLQWELEAQCRRMGVEVGEELSTEPAQLRCPYCAHVAPPSEMHTEETVDYLKCLINREIVIPQLNRFTSDLEDRFPSRGHSSGMLSISLEFNASRIALPPRPIHGPEPPDLTVIDFLCCGQKIKVSNAWRRIDECVYCGAGIAALV